VTQSNCPTRALFQTHGLRCTQQRMAIYDALREARDHPTAEALFKRVGPHVKRLSLATVYNTLETLCAAGLARRLPLNGCCRFEVASEEHLHIRFADNSEIADVPQELGSRLIDNLPREALDAIERELGVSIESVQIQLVAQRHNGNAAPSLDQPQMNTAQHSRDQHKTADERG
jgi:Fe2+ or Zn2+ uptake regulation protein